MVRRIRQTKFTVHFGFVCDGGSTHGIAEPKEMKYADLALALAMVDPFNHDKWMGQVDSLRRSGDHVVISLTSESDTHGTVGRVVKITRN